MRGSFLLFLIMISGTAFAQFSKNKFGRRFDKREIYISLNPFSVAEPQFIFGPSFGQRLTERSEYFIEAAYVAKTPFYRDWQDIKKLRGARIIVQYRYHFRQQWKPLFAFGTGRQRLRSRHQPFIGFEFRIKPVSFSTIGNFINSNINDTLYQYPYNANAFILGGAIIFGHTYNLSSDEKWKLEFAAGIGAKHRIVNFRSEPAGYKIMSVNGGFAFRIPLLHEEFGTAYFPCAIRIRYILD